MKKLFAVACCASLAGCAADGLSHFSSPSPMETGAPLYAPGTTEGFEAPPEHITSTCVMKGQSAVCH